jgi:hypothetical protein
MNRDFILTRIKALSAEDKAYRENNKTLYAQNPAFVSIYEYAIREYQKELNASK